MSTTTILFYALYIVYFILLVFQGAKVTRKQNEIFAKHGITYKGRGRYQELEKIMTQEEKRELTLVGTRFARFAGFGFLLVAIVTILYLLIR